MKVFLLVLSTAVALTKGHAQVTDTTSTVHGPFSSHHREITLLAGYDQGYHGAAELGLAYNIHGVNHHPYAFALFIANEMNIVDEPMMGPKIGAWLAGGFAMGAQFIYYTDLADGSLAFRPEIGLGLHKFKFTYGYNLRLTNKELEPVNSHVAGLVYCFRLKRLKGDDRLR